MPNFEDVGTLGTIKSYAKASAGDVLVEYGEFKGRSENQFGFLYEFTEVESGEKIAVPNCGQIEYLYDKGTLKIGYRYKVVYEGKKTLERGAMKGKEANQVKVMQDRDYNPGAVPAQTTTKQDQEDDILA